MSGRFGLPDDLPKVYTLPEVAALFRVSVPTLRNWIRDGKMQAVRLPGGTLRVLEDEVERISSGDGTAHRRDPSA